MLIQHLRITNYVTRKKRNQNVCPQQRHIHTYNMCSLLRCYIHEKKKKQTGIKSSLYTSTKSPCLIQKDNPHIYFIGFVKYVTLRLPPSFCQTVRDELN